MQDLASRDGAFFATGNHEYFVDDTASWLVELERLGVKPLRNENTVIRRAAAAFDLVGVNDVAGEQRSSPPATQLYVTRGAGFWGPPPRVGATPDITVLSLEV